LKEAYECIKRTYEIARVTRGEDHPLTQEAQEKKDVLQQMMK
jgi:hypothetical protein